MDILFPPSPSSSSNMSTTMPWFDFENSALFNEIPGFQTKDFAHSQNAELLLLKQVIPNSPAHIPPPHMRLEDPREEFDVTMLLSLPSPCSRRPAVDLSLSSVAIKNANDGGKKMSVKEITMEHFRPVFQPPPGLRKRSKSAEGQLTWMTNNKRSKGKTSLLPITAGPPQLVATYSDLLCCATPDTRTETLRRVHAELILDPLDDLFEGNDGNKVVRAKSLQNLKMRGENRLKIHFIQFGSPGVKPQKFGQHGCGIPEGLCGCNQVYDQYWRFHISHVQEGATTLIAWQITNLASSTVTRVVETAQKAALRENSGRTICNIVLRQAFESRAQELENTLLELADNPTRLFNVQVLIKALRPIRCTVGLLFFGLLHDVVQHRLEVMMESEQHGALH